MYGPFITSRTYQLNVIFLTLLKTGRSIALYLTLSQQSGSYKVWLCQVNSLTYFMFVHYIQRVP